LAGCARYHGPLTYLGDADLFPVGRWAGTPQANQVAVQNGIYPIPAHHLILVHILVDPHLTSLGPGAVHGAVGVWWVALDDRVPGPRDSAPTWLPSGVCFRTGALGAAFDAVGSYLDGPAAGSLSRYPISLNPEDGSISVALSAADEIAVPRRTSATAGPYLPPAPGVRCVAS
jgi:hypothetical protein